FIQAAEVTRARHVTGVQTCPLPILKNVLDKVNEAKYRSSGIVDRHYFKALYITAPGNITVEVSTDGPGFTVDEPLETLGESLSLPPKLQEERDFIEMRLHPLSD